MVVVVSIAALHVEAVIALDARGSTGTFTAHFLTDAARMFHSVLLFQENDPRAPEFIETLDHLF